MYVMHYTQTKKHFSNKNEMKKVQKSGSKKTWKKYRKICENLTTTLRGLVAESLFLFRVASVLCSMTPYTIYQGGSGHYKPW